VNTVLLPGTAYNLIWSTNWFVVGWEYKSQAKVAVPPLAFATIAINAMASRVTASVFSFFIVGYRRLNSREFICPSGVSKPEALAISVADA
jgi:hypothetical protein